MAFKTNAPLAGRPPFATDEPDSVQPKPQDNRPDSAYDVYDNYIDDKKPRQSGYGDLGAGFLNGDLEDDYSDDETIACHTESKKGSDERLPLPPALNKFPAVPIVAPKPGYAAPVSALTMPEPTANPFGQQRGQQMSQVQQQGGRGPAPLSIPNRGAYSATPVPSTPHPLQPPMTPITPAFARPPKKSEESGITFDGTSIMRGKDEEVPLARRGQRGDEFWRRFSMVVKEEGDRKSTSSWLEKSQNGAASLSRMVWIIGLLLIIIIGGAIGFGWYVSHNNATTTTTSPKALGGSQNEGATLTITASNTATGVSSSSHVAPTKTVAKRWPMPEPSSVVASITDNHMEAFQPVVHANSSTQHKRMHKRRGLQAA
ncbi:hypothetical protein DFH11DRAFT_1593806 [Phellopilus nigrolimitatus]|nr:hypothetical protein DFH11DRAFT_1593806 [Phellopilus nigrolimitatus]